MLNEEKLFKFKTLFADAEQADTLIEAYRDSCRYLETPEQLENPQHEQGYCDALEFTITLVIRDVEIK